MPLVTFRYRFSIVLPAPPDVAFRWATDYRPDDWSLMGQVGSRRIARLAKDVIVLRDTTGVGRDRVTKTRLVRLLPERRAWTNTHLAGPARLSQFLYELRPVGRSRSRLVFTGLQVLRPRRALSASARAREARATARADRELWRRLARAMGRELRPRRRARTSSAARRAGQP